MEFYVWAMPRRALDARRVPTGAETPDIPEQVDGSFPVVHLANRGCIWHCTGPVKPASGWVAGDPLPAGVVAALRIAIEGAHRFA